MWIGEMCCPHLRPTGNICKEKSKQWCWLCWGGLASWILCKSISCGFLLGRVECKLRPTFFPAFETHFRLFPNTCRWGSPLASSRKMSLQDISRKGQAGWISWRKGVGCILEGKMGEQGNEERDRSREGTVHMGPLLAGFYSTSSSRCGAKK